MKRRKRACIASGCTGEPHLGGLCKEHYQERTFHAQRRDAAIHTLHTGLVDSSFLSDTALKEELLKLRKWWDWACRAAQKGQDVEHMPLDEAEYALEWCISLAQEIIDAELALRAGKGVSDSLAITRNWVWDRFHNLERGLRSNGLPRDTSR